MTAMDAFELTHPVLSAAAVTAPLAPPVPRRFRHRPPAPAPAVEEALVAIRRLAYQLPLGSAPRPLAGRDRWSFAGAAREVERAVGEVAAAHGVHPSGDGGIPALVRRLARCRAIVPPAAEAVARLLPVLEAGAAGQVDDASLEPSAAKLAERLVGYLQSRA